MGTTNRNVFTDACIYIGGNDCFGKASKVTPPSIKYGKHEIKDLGTIGAMNLPNGKINDALECTITLNSFYPDIFKKIANPFKAVDLKVYSNFTEFENDDATGNVGTKLFLRGSSQEFGLLGEQNQHDNMDYEMKFDLTMARLVVDNKELYYIDIPNNVFIIDGVDVRKDIVKNLGLV